MHISELSPRPVRGRTADAGPARRQAETARVVGLTYRQAERLLDWLDSHGCTKAEVELDEAGGFAVRFAPPRDWWTRHEGGKQLVMCGTPPG
jgi:hypothetical protein